MSGPHRCAVGLVTSSKVNRMLGRERRSAASLGNSFGPNAPKTPRTPGSLAQPMRDAVRSRGASRPDDGKRRLQTFRKPTRTRRRRVEARPLRSVAMGRQHRKSAPPRAATRARLDTPEIRDGRDRGARPPMRTFNPSCGHARRSLDAPDHEVVSPRGAASLSTLPIAFARFAELSIRTEFCEFCECDR